MKGRPNLERVRARVGGGARHLLVCTRYLHSAIHCTYNHVMHRFAAYAVASLFLWIMVVRLALAALAAA